MNRCESDTRPASCVSARYGSQNQSAMPLDELRQYGSDSYSGRGSGDSDDGSNLDPLNCSQGNADRNATEAESGDDGSEAQKFDEQSENGSDDSSEHTPAQPSKRQPFTQRSDDADLPDLVDEASDEGTR